MPLMLKQKGTGDMYGYTAIMAARPDMEVIEESDISPVNAATPAPKVKKTRRPKKAAAVAIEKAPETVPSAVLEDLATAFPGEE